MNINKILKFARLFESLAADKESLPENSKDLKVVLKNLDSLETFCARKEYAEKNLKHLSSGSSRIAYLTTNDSVVKLAKNEKGLAQNKAEVNSKVKSKFLNKILKHSKDYVWIESDYLDKLSEKQFEELTDVNFKDFGNAVGYFFDKHDKPKDYDDIKELEIFKEITNIAKKNNLVPGDLARISSYGTNGDYPILLDAGLTKKIYDEFYED